MSAIRTTTGCWTCRIRKKKCTEEQPACSKCMSLQITCYGYGIKPTWMDGGLSKKAQAQDIKTAIKERNKRKKKPESYLMTRRIVLEMESTQVEGQSSGSTVGSEQTEIAQSEKSPDNLNGDYALFDDITGPNSVATTYQKPLNLDMQTDDESNMVRLGTQNPAITEDTSAQECRCNLLMHYLDHVFPLQFRFYNPLICEGGRGWLLNILLHTKPLLHAALSLSACHQVSLLPPNTEIYSCGSIVKDQERYHSLTLLELRHHIENLRLATVSERMTSRVEILACMIQLISFEVFRGDNNNWQTHLKAARSLFMDIKDCFTMPTKVFDSRSITVTTTGIERPYTSTGESSLSSAEVLALDFFASALVWFDILSSVTTKWTPEYPAVFSSILQIEDGRIQLCKLMGCKNWVMVAIMDIATLAEWKAGGQKRGNLSLRELALRAAAIEQRLKDGIIQNAEVPSMSYIDSCGVRALESQAVTHIFACSALIYLYVIQSGPYPEIIEIKEAVTESIKAFRNLSDGRWVRHLVWPFCIAGCMAGEEHVDDFRQIALHANTDGEIFGNLKKALAIMEECWRGRQEDTHTLWTWTAAMASLGIEVLLI